MRNHLPLQWAGKPLAKKNPSFGFLGPSCPSSGGAFAEDPGPTKPSFGQSLDELSFRELRVESAAHKKVPGCAIPCQ